MLKNNTELGALKSLVIAGIVWACSVGVAQAVSVAFSGGNNTPLTFTVANDVTWSLSASEASALNGSHALIGIGIALGQVPASVTNGSGTVSGGSVTTTGTGVFGINGNTFYSNNNNGGTNNGGIIAFNLIRTTNFVAGDTITIESGFSVTTSDAVVASYSSFSGGDYDILFINGLDATPLSVAAGQSVPEASSALLASLGLGVLAFRRNRRTS